MNKTIAVFGSSRRNGNTGKLIDIIAKQLNIEVIDLSLKIISPFDYEHKNLDDDFLPLMDYILKFENIIFVSPVYWFAMSAPMKTFVDRFSDFLSVEELKGKGRKLRGKFGYVVSTSISEEIDNSFINSFSDTFQYLGMENGGFIHVNCENGFDLTGCEDDITNFVKKLNPYLEEVAI
ncbi:MAG: NAD(P)H-dependent oxidoreductase [Oleispira sp.]|nr:NAD(P)H-dependent oxidoreductase [Oleispira sp.]